ncbi:TPA: hypothetical protein G8W61_005328 [Salmonella enterica]|uniref:LngG n=1 Tax=Salmonella enterica TaxID=28901 RepID=A0A759YQJ6_SALER|nr:hypothetical protein [Salmonella enterica]
MQKINLILTALFLTSFCLNAAAETPVSNASGPAPLPATSGQPPDEAAVPPGSATVTAPVTAGQDQIVRALQDDIVFERQKRQLSNELALEKLRAELQKVRGESRPAVTMPVTPPSVAMPVREEQHVSVPQAAPPTVVLVSQVAGVSRVGISVNGQLRFVGRQEKFAANGKKYQLVSEKNRLVAREVK